VSAPGNVAANDPQRGNCPEPVSSIFPFVFWMPPWTFLPVPPELEAQSCCDIFLPLNKTGFENPCYRYARIHQGSIFDIRAMAFTNHGRLIISSDIERDI